MYSNQNAVEKFFPSKILANYPEPHIEGAVPIEDFPEYSITKEGRIYTRRNGLERRASMTREGAVKITLYYGGVPYTRSLPLLVAKAFLWNDHNPEIFDTPIHLDNDLSHNHVDNLAWRPRWFAVKYQKQYWNPEFRNATTMIEDTQTGRLYDSYIEPCQQFGILYMDVIQSCLRGGEVFPTRKRFVYV